MDDNSWLVGAGSDSIGAAIPAVLARYGVEVLFGIPGVHTLEVFRGLPASGIRHVLTRHEQGSVYAADGYARVTGRVGAVFLIDGPGLTNAATAIAQALHDCIPLLILSAGPPRTLPFAGMRLHQMPDQQAFMTTITTGSRRVESAPELDEALSDAWSRFDGIPGPVHIEVPTDLLQEPGTLVLPAASRTATRQPADCPDIADAADILAAARRPLLLLGGGARDAGGAAVALAERLGAPIVTTLNGKGAVDEDHWLHLGTSLPTKAVINEIEEADVVVAIGTQFCEVDYYYAERVPRPHAIVRIDIDKRIIDRPMPASAALLGDARATLAALSARLGEPTADQREAGRNRTAAIRRRIQWWPDAERLRPALDAISAELPDDSVVVIDSTQLGYAGQHLWRAHHPRSWLVPAGWGTLGPSLPMALGAALGAPERPVICVCGDGGLLFTIGELASIADLRLPITLIIWNNHGYGEMRDAMDHAGIPHVGVDGGLHDPASVLTGFGWTAHTARTPAQLQNTVRSSIQARLPTAVIVDAAAILASTNP